MNSEGRGLLPDSNVHTYTNIQGVMKGTKNDHLTLKMASAHCLNISRQ